MDEAGRDIDLEPDPFNGQNTIELKHTVASAQYLVNREVVFLGGDLLYL